MLRWNGLKRLRGTSRWLFIVYSSKKIFFWLYFYRLKGTPPVRLNRHLC